MKSVVLVASDIEWIVLEHDQVMRCLRKAAGLTIDEASMALGMPPTPGSASAVTSPELRGQAIQLGKLLARAERFGLEVQIRVRKRDRKDNDDAR